MTNQESGTQEPDHEADGDDDPSDELADDVADEPTEGISAVAPLLASRISALVGMSDVIKNMQLNLAPALRIVLPAWPHMAANLQAVEALQRYAADSIGVAQFAASVLRLDTRFLQNFAGFAKVVQAQQEQIAKILQAAQPSLDGLFPPDWRGVDVIETDLIKQIVLDEGIPLVAVPRAATV